MIKPLEQPNYEIAELFGETIAEADREQIFAEVSARYADGEPLDDIALDYKTTGESLRGILKKYDLIKYRESKGKAVEARLDARERKYGRGVSFAVNKLVELLEGGEKISIGDLCRIEKTLGDRLAIMRGEATSSEKQTLEIVNFSEIKNEDTN